MIISCKYNYNKKNKKSICIESDSEEWDINYFGKNFMEDI